LQGTGEEARAISPLIPGAVTVLTGEQASESAVRAAPPARVMHFATHGFFLADPSADGRGPDVLGRRTGDTAPAADANPMVRSGLALAGANYADSIAQGDDGILTALEVTSLDLHATDLVVLSACETGLGKVQVGEGVYGLRRAFVLAGARNLVLSLWQVNDQITRELMERFYRSYASGHGVAEALRAAELDTIADLRRRTGGVAPVNLWAPFVTQQTGS
jgi:CHAT domain-containing protein